MSDVPRSGSVGRPLCRAAWLVPVLLVVVVLMYFSPVLWGSGEFPSDGQLAAYFAAPQLWSAAWATGWPAVGDPLSMLLYPLRVLLTSLGAGFEVFVVVAYAVAVVGMYAYLRCLVDRLPAAFGALAFSLSGWMLVHLGHTSMVHAAAWLPWIMLGVHQGCLGTSSRRLAGVALLAVAVAMGLAAGHAQITVYSMWLAGGYTLYLVLAHRAWGGLLLCAGGVLLGVLMAAPVLLPALELASHTPRSELGREDIYSYAFLLAELPGLMVPLLYGSSPNGWFAVGYRNPMGIGETITFLPTVGVLLCLLALTGFRRRPVVLFFAIYGVLALCLAMGQKFALARLITEHVFALDMFRAPSRHFLELTFCFAVLSAMGLQALLCGEAGRARLWWVAVLLCLGLLSAVVLALALRGAMGMNLADMIKPLILAVLAVAAALLVLWLHRQRPLAAAWLALGLLLGQTLLIGHQLPWRPDAMNKAVSVAPEWAPSMREALGSDYRGLAMEGWEALVFNPDASRLHGVPVLGWYGPLLNASVAQLTGLTTGGWIQRYVLNEANVTLDLLSVRYVGVGQAELPLVEGQPHRWRRVASPVEPYLYENRRALPRARLVCRLGQITDEQACVDALHQGTRTLSVADTAYLNAGQTIPAMLDEGCRGAVDILEDAGHSMRLQAKGLAGPTLLVLADLWYPGWMARVNGVQTPVLRVNNTSRAILVEEDALIELNYRPSHWGVALLMILAGVVGVLLILVAGLRLRGLAGKGVKKG